MTTLRSEARLQEHLADITRLLDKHRVLETLTQRQEGPRKDILESLQHRQNLVELQRRLRGMHTADIAYLSPASRIATGASYTCSGDCGPAWRRLSAPLPCSSNRAR